jgi:hypothetical protein
MTRATNTTAIFTGQEPKFAGELSKMDLIKALNWYNQNRAEKDSYKYAADYLKKKHKVSVSSLVDGGALTFGFCCRIVANGGTLPDQNQSWFQTTVQEYIQKSKQTKIKAVETPTKSTPNIQQRLTEKVNEIAGDLEGAIDDYMDSGYKRAPSPYAIMQDRAKGMHANRLIEIFKARRSEYAEVLDTDDADLKEGYRNFTKAQLKKMVAYCDLIITDALKIAGDSVKTRKPRKRKVKSADQVVAKMNYLDKHEKYTSIDPKQIIGAMALWVYNTKTRKLGCYLADNAAGLGVKGSSLLNYTESKSIQKKLRKPEVTLNEALNGGKVALRNLIGNIRAVESPLTGRINKDTILLRVTK